MELTVIIIAIVALALICINLLAVRSVKKQAGEVDTLLNEIRDTLKESRDDYARAQKLLRDEVANNISVFKESVNERIDSAGKMQIEKIERASAMQQEKLDKATLVQMERLAGFADLQRVKLEQLDKTQQMLVANTESKLENIRVTVEEKLDKTLADRLGRSFETVGKQLSEVQQGLGEMKNLAQDVGGLKRVLTNVKLRGGLGEVQLEMLLENILAPGQYEANVCVKSGSREVVEFAVKLPGNSGNAEPVWLPIDAKFPKDVYEKLQTAYDLADSAAMETAQKELENAIKLNAKDIATKYLDPPHTTNFAIMFLPFEGIYAEVVRKADLLEEVQRRYNVIITGPTTLAAILNSLQMGFKTLAIQRRSSEVWETLAAVKTEFETFGGILEKAKNKIQGGISEIDTLVGTRTRVIQRKLKEVESLDNEQSHKILDKN
ncbi:MAG: DNA recombination protein RmuC [Bacteroidales bacterium]|nr:DNA recombination protein RmuC [Bacteroidales bacterium]